MSLLERAGRELVDEPVAPPTPIAALERRASELRRHRRVRTATVLSSVIVVLAVAIFSVARPTHSDQSVTPMRDPGSTTQPSPPRTRTESPLSLGAGSLFVPSTRSAGDRTLMPITLLNNDTIELEYPTSLQLASLGFVPATAIHWEDFAGGNDCCGRTLEVRHGTIDQVFAGRSPTKVYRGPGGEEVPYFTGTNINYLAFQIGEWTVAVPDYEGTTLAPNNTAMNDRQRAGYATRLTGHETADGFLVLTPSEPLTLRYTDVPSATFGDGAVNLIYRACTSNTRIPAGTHGFNLETQDPETGTWLCYDRIPIVVHITGTQDFQQQVTRGLQIPTNHQSGYG